MGQRTSAQHSLSSDTPTRSSIAWQRPFQSSLHDSPVQTQAEEQPDLQRELAIAQRTTPNWPQMTVGGTPSVVQAKLTVGAPGDQYEQEADRVADQVMSMPDSAIQQPVQREANLEDDEVQTKAIAGMLQREEIPEEEEVQTKSLGSIQREEMPEDEEVQTKPALQRSSEGSLQAGRSIESRLNSSKGGGEPLSDEVRAFMEPRFGADFSQVRVHTGSEAVQMNQDLNAQAFTHKQDVYFGAGKAPEKDALTAHELTHVVQQTENGACKLNPKIQREISTPVPWDSSEDVKAQKDGSVKLKVAQVSVTIKPDKKTSKKNWTGRAYTKHTLSWKIPDPITRNNKIVTIKSAPTVQMMIQTTYGPTSDPYDKSGYGKGTTEEDIQKGNTTLKYHEGSHGVDGMEYLRQNPLPELAAQEDMSVEEYKQAVKKFNQDMREYQSNLSKYSKQQTDCVGTPSQECE